MPVGHFSHRLPLMRCAEPLSQRRGTDCKRERWINDRFRPRNERTFHHLPAGHFSQRLPLLRGTEPLSQRRSQRESTRSGSSATGSHRGTHCKRERWINDRFRPRNERTFHHFPAGHFSQRFSLLRSTEPRHSADRSVSAQDLALPPQSRIAAQTASANAG